MQQFILCKSYLEKEQRRGQECTFKKLLICWAIGITMNYLHLKAYFGCWQANLHTRHKKLYHHHRHIPTSYGVGSLSSWPTRVLQTSMAYFYEFVSWPECSKPVWHIFMSSYPGFKYPHWFKNWTDCFKPRSCKIMLKIFFSGLGLDASTPF